LIETGIFVDSGVNIERMRFFQSKNNPNRAVTIVETSAMLSDDIARATMKIDKVITAIYLPKIN